jgi:UDP-MurNAc hydroxylase
VDDAGTDADDSEIVLDGHVLPRWCPHRGADLSRFGVVEDEHVVCVVHGRRFPLSDFAPAQPSGA